MATSRSLRQIRVTLAAGVVTRIFPPSASFSRCVVGASSCDVNLYTNDDLSEFRTITQGFERVLIVPTFYFRGDEVAFWLESDIGGLVILEWS